MVLCSLSEFCVAWVFCDFARRWDFVGNLALCVYCGVDIIQKFWGLACGFALCGSLDWGWLLAGCFATLRFTVGIWH